MYKDPTKPIILISFVEGLQAPVNIIRIHPGFFPRPSHLSNILTHKKTFLLLILAKFGKIFLDPSLIE